MTKNDSAIDRCNHYDREEIDFHLIIAGQLRKFVRCKNCEAWLFEQEQHSILDRIRAEFEKCVNEDIVINKDTGFYEGHFRVSKFRERLDAILTQAKESSK